ncbi:hemicentin-1-like isoform X2 [Mya arenaria]|uniref:hemicentin-1-like isoform X2 n=1 Tax=Mya arenaria TaxID=6604 RepID=UPI0022E34808|nr:hemicentin-1-like isoform X2 [Mya arenaria]
MLIQNLKLILVVYWITNLGMGVTLSGNGTSGGFTVQENSPLQLTCSSSTDTQYVTYSRRYTDKSPNIITAVGYGSSGCATDPTPPSYLSCSCVSRREYVCVIRNVTRAMHGDVWFCLPARGIINDANGDKAIVVTIGITTVSVVFPAGSSVSVIENTTRQFRCETSAGNPQATMEWYKDNGTPDRTDDTLIISGTETDTRASGTVIVTIGKLTLTAHRNDQEVRVYCRANNGGDWQYSSSVVLDVQYEPSTPTVSYIGFEVTSHIRVISGRSMTLTCSSTGNPSPTYTWTYPGGGPHSGPTLTLASVLQTHTGGVTCTSINTLSPTGGKAVDKIQQTTISLQVLYPPRSPTCTISGTSISTTAILVEGTDYTISCISSANPPLIAYSWSTPGRAQVSGANLTLINVQNTADQGQYTLTVTNTMDATIGNTETGTSNTSFLLNIQFEISTPIVSYRGFAIISHVRVISGRSMTLNCSSLGNPSPAYAWTYPGGGSHVGPNLIFTSVQTTLAGNVTCTAWNTLSPTGGTALVKTKQATASLQVLCPPDSPRGFKVIPNTITSYSVVLTWIPGFNNGLLQTFHISYRPSIPFADWLEMNVTHTGETEMNVTLDNLEPGESYIVELYALNLEGKSAITNITFSTLTHTPSEISHLKTQTSTIAGGVTAGIVLILGISVVIFVFRRKYSVSCAFKLNPKEDSPLSHTGQGTGNPGYNAAVTYEEMSMTNNKTVYDTLDIGNDGSKASHVFTSLDDSKSNEYYENVKTEDPVYNNTSLKTPVQKVL